jgi:myo-inositol-1(or 4)-monophosphatase
MNEPWNWLAELARNAVRDGVNTLLASDASDGRVVLENGRDIKLEADLLLSRELTSRLTRASGMRCISEEDMEIHGFPENEPVWIVDPLDGSMNYARRVPLYGVSVALWQEGEPVIGIIHDIERNRTLAACDGRAWAENIPIRISPVKEMGRAVLATGFPLMTDTSPNAESWFLGFARRFKKVRMLGTAALSMAWVAEGRLDAYFERDIMVWDVAAGIAMVKGAGGVCMTRPGNHPMTLDVIAANNELAESMGRELRWL